MRNLFIITISALLIILLSACGPKKEITFETNGGSAIASTHFNEEYYLPEDISTVKKGYTFDAWYFDPLYTLLYTGEEKINVDTTLYAKWTMNRYIVTLDLSSYDDSGDTHSLSRLYKTAGPVQIIVLEGYNFIGWYTDEEFSIEYDDTTQTIEDYTIYGKYEEIE